MKQLLLAATILAAFSIPAAARLQLSISANGSTFSCFDGELGCDQSGGANNLLVVNTTVGGAFVEIALAQSTFAPDVLQLSSSSIVNNSGAPITIRLVAGDTSFAPPVTAIRESASLTFNDAVGSASSSLSFFADHANGQGANPLNTPGVLLDTVFGTPTSNPDSFSGSLVSPFAALTPFSMTESANLSLIAGGSITGFNQSEQSVPIPEISTWFMVGVGGFAIAGLGRRRRSARCAF